MRTIRDHAIPLAELETALVRAGFVATTGFRSTRVVEFIHEETNEVVYINLSSGGGVVGLVIDPDTFTSLGNWRVEGAEHVGKNHSSNMARFPKRTNKSKSAETIPYGEQIKFRSAAGAAEFLALLVGSATSVESDKAPTDDRSKQTQFIQTHRFDSLFSSFWDSLLARLRANEDLLFKPLDGNPRRIEFMDESLIKLRETTERGHRGESTRNELGNDFWKLSNDLDLAASTIPHTRSQHSIKNYFEFKRDMFEAFKLFSQLSSPIDIETEDLSDEEIDAAILANRLRLGIIVTGTSKATIRQRRGQDRLHYLTLQNYDQQCAVCDVNDPTLLIASHIAGWAEAPEFRGRLSNVICLCRFHDALFESGYWSLTDDLKVVRSVKKGGKVVEMLLYASTKFRRPRLHAPDAQFLAIHRKRCQLER